MELISLCCDAGQAYREKTIYASTEAFQVCHQVRDLQSPVNRKQFVRSFRGLLLYSSRGTRGVSKVILSGEHHDGQKITIGNGKEDIERVQAG
jgi:hypothetical protein